MDHGRKLVAPAPQLHWPRPVVVDRSALVHSCFSTFLNKPTNANDFHGIFFARTIKVLASSTNFIMCGQELAFYIGELAAFAWCSVSRKILPPFLNICLSSDFNK